MFPAPNWYLQRTCSWSSDGRKVALASRDAVILLERTNEGTDFKTYGNLRGHKDKVTAVQFWKGDMCVSASEDGDVRIWDIHARRCVRRIPKRTSGLRCLGTSSNNNIVAFGHVDCVTLWNLSSKEDEILIVQSEIWSHTTITCISNIVQRDDEILAVGLESGVVCLVNVRRACVISRDFESYSRTKSPHSPIHHLEWNCTHDVIGASCEDACIKLWNSNDGTLLHRFILDKNTNNNNKKRRKPWYTFAWTSPQVYFDDKNTGRLVSGQSIVASSGDGTIFMYTFRWRESGGGKERKRRRCVDISRCAMKTEDNGHTRSVFSIVPCPSEMPPRHVLSISMDRTMCVWNLAQCRCMRRYGMLGGFAYDMNISDSRLVVACGDGMIRVLDRKMNLNRHVWKGLVKKRILTLSIHPFDSSKIACGTHDGCVYVYNNVDDRESLDSDMFLRIKLRKDNISIENVQWQIWNVNGRATKDDEDLQPLLYVIYIYIYVLVVVVTFLISLTLKTNILGTQEIQRVS